MTRLSRATVASSPAGPPPWIAEPGEVRIAHLGPGPFHRAHQAAFTDAVYASTGERWGIAVCSARSDRAVTTLHEQGGLYSIVTRDGTATTARFVGAIAETGTRARFAELLADPAVTTATMTVTERHYPRRRDDGGGGGGDGGGTSLDDGDALVAGDLADGTTASLPGLLHAGLSRRWHGGGDPIAVVSCDNLRANGRLTGALVREFAERAAAPRSYRAWLDDTVRFPNTVVDRLVPTPTDADRADAARLLGLRDDAAVGTEPYATWIIERVTGVALPPWDRAGGQTVDDTTRAERTKLHVLNGAHSLLAAALGLLMGADTVAAAMAIDPLAHAVERFHEREVLPRLGADVLDDGLDPGPFAAAVRTRFTNPAMHHPLAQIAALGSLKLTERIMPLAATEGELDLCAVAVAAWLRLVECDERIGATIDEPCAAAVRDVLPTDVAAALDEAGLVARGDLPVFVSLVASQLADLRRVGASRVVTAVTGG